MRLEPFAMERMQSTYENHVDFNLSESGIHPLRLGDLVDDTAGREALMAEGLRYTQSNGTIPLRDAIAALYLGATVREWPLVDAHRRWSVDAERLARVTTSRTKMIIICNPNNPTGARFDA